MGLLLKNWKLILDILLIAAVVVIIFAWNPFGIFGGGLKLTPTANMVTKIQEMGQLVTAEYYGEVIASIEESRLSYLESEETGAHAAEVYDDLYAALQELFDFQQLPVAARESAYKTQEPIPRWRRIIKQDVTRQNILDKLLYHQSLEDVSSDPMYEQVLAYIREKNLQRSWDGSTRHKEEALLALYSEIGTNSNITLDTADFLKYHYQKLGSAISRKEKRKKLAMIGRGWVKAGFDFGKMDRSTFYVNDEAGEVHFFGLSAVILNADINPWFIPEKGVPGFEILDYNGQVDFRDAKKVKQYCINKLITNAQRSQILEHAERNGAETLKSLFSLLSGKEIKKVFFHHDPVSRLSQEISADEWVNYHEASLLDSVLKLEWKAIDSLEKTRENSYKNKQLAQHRRNTMAAVLDNLQRLPFEDLPGNFNYYSKAFFEVAQDSILEAREYQLLKEKRRLKTFEASSNNTSLDTLWYQDTLSMTRHYNAGIGYLINKGVMTGQVADSTLSKDVFSADFLKANRVLEYSPIGMDSVVVKIFIEDPVPQEVLYQLLYPYEYREEEWKQTMSRKSIILDSLSLPTEDSIKVTKATSLVFHALPRPHLVRFDIPVQQMVNPLLLSQQLDTPIIWITESFAVIVKNVPGQALTSSQNTRLTDQQVEELENYYRHLLEEHHRINNKGPFVRASEWMQKKFENNKSVKERFAELSQKLGG